MPQPPANDPSRRRAAQPVFGVILVVLLMLGITGPAQADELRRGGQWLPATILRVEDGQLVYRPAAGGERTVPLGEVQSIKLDDEEAFFTALEAFAAEDYRAAARTFGEIAEQTRTDWVRDYARYYQVQALDQRGEPLDAAEVFVALARDGADPYFLSIPPTGSLDEANDNQRDRIRASVMDVITDAEGPTRVQLEAYLRAVVGEEQMPDLNPDTPGTPNGDNASAVDRGGSAVILPDHLWAFLEQDDADELEKWAALQLLSEGKYEESIDALAPWLTNPNDMPEKLFILGRAQLALAEETGEDEAYLDAGLTFMRVVVHYGSGRNPSALANPARLEVAYIHRAIGRDDIYEKLLFDQNLMLSFDNDPETFPEYYKRYYEIIGEPVPEPEADDPEE